MPDSSTVGYLPFDSPGLNYGLGGFGNVGAEYDAELDAIFQTMVAGLSGIAGNLVRPRWQPGNPIQPEPTVNWASVGVMEITDDAGPYIFHDPIANSGDGTDVMYRHETIEMLASFYGPNAQGVAKQVAHSIADPQNNANLEVFSMTLVSTGALVSTSELVNKQWQRRYDLPFRVRRQVSRSTGILTILSAEIDLSTGAAPIGYGGGPGYGDPPVYGGGPLEINQTVLIEPED